MVKATDMSVVCSGKSALPMTFDQLAGYDPTNDPLGIIYMTVPGC